MLRANYHTHTTFCDGTSTAEEMVQQALDLGFVALGFSSHVDPGIPMDWAELAGQLYDYQFPQRVSGVRLRWGEAFYAALNKKQGKSEEEEHP